MLWSIEKLVVTTHLLCWTQLVPSKHSSWWRRLEDVFRLRLQKTSSKRLDQDEYVCLSLTSSEDVSKTSSRRLGQDQYIRFGHTSSRRLQDVFKMSSRRLAKASSRHFQDAFKTFWKRLQDIFKTFSRRNIKLNLRDIFETSSKRFWDVLVRRLSTGGLPRSYFREIYGHCAKFPTVIKIFQVLIFHFTIPFSGYTSQRRI